MLASCGRPLASLCVNDLFWRRTDGVLCLLAWHSLYYALWHVGYYAYVTCHLAYCTLCLTYCATGPGESDCQFFLKTGNCKFGDGCKFNHPRDKVRFPTLPTPFVCPRLLCCHGRHSGTLCHGANAFARQVAATPLIAVGAQAHDAAILTRW